jgi:hypothetical protein
MTLSHDAHADEITFELATLLLRGETLELVDDIGGTWEATASTLHRRHGEEHRVFLEGADAFDVLSALAKGLAAASASNSNDDFALGSAGFEVREGVFHVGEVEYSIDDDFDLSALEP